MQGAKRGGGLAGCGLMTERGGGGHESTGVMAGKGAENDQHLVNSLGRKDKKSHNFYEFLRLLL